jgi:hypothetical protein
MSIKYRISDDDKELGPFDAVTMQGMFYRGSISNKAKYREDGSSDHWRMITDGFPQWGKGCDTPRLTRGDRRRVTRAARRRKRKQFRSRPLGVACFAIACMLWLLPFAYVYWVSHLNNMITLQVAEEQHLSHDDVAAIYNSEEFKASRETIRRNAQIFLFWVAAPGSAFLFWWGRRLRSVSAEALLAKDSRPPVVYFRSFQDDLKFVVPASKRRGVLGTKRYRTEEEEIVKELNRIGPVVAIGDPKEAVPLAGASRLYATDDTWHEVAEKLLASAALVVYRFGSSPGFVWELKRGRDHIQPERLVFLIPRSEDDDFYDARYSKFREQIHDVINLPETLESPIICFQQDWTPEAFGKGYSRFYKRLRDFVSSRVG